MVDHCRAALVLATTLLLLRAPLARGEPAELRYDLRIDLSVTLATTTGWIASELLKSELAARDCRWCDRNADGTDGINGLDAWVRGGLKWSNIDAADTISYLTGYVATPLAAAGFTALAASHDGRLRELPIDLLIMAEATAIAGALTQAVKFAAGRERPFVHALAPEQKARTAHPLDNNTSFFSSHTSVTFALAVSAGTVASLRGYRWARWVWLGGLAVATTTGYLRLASDRHYFTDVLSGTIVGSAVGFAVPYLHRPRAKASTHVTVAALPGRTGLAACVVW